MFYRDHFCLHISGLEGPSILSQMIQEDQLYCHKWTPGQFLW